MKKTIKDKEKKRVSITLFFGVLCTFVFLAWVGQQIVVGKEDKHIFIFPTEVSGQGWKNIEAVHGQSVGGNGGFEDFSESNSAFITVEGSVEGLEEISNEEQVVSESAEETVEAEEELSAETEEIPVFQESDDEDVFNEESAVEEVVIEEDLVEEIAEEQAEEVVEEVAEEVIEEEPEEENYETENAEEVEIQPEAFFQDSKKLFFLAWVKDSMIRSIGTQVFAQENIAEEIVEDLEGETEGDDLRQDQDQEEVSVCTISGKECYTMQFAGFNIGDALSESKINNIQLRFSFASKAPTEGFSNDTFIIRYFYNGSWYIAGEFSLEGELSNALNGGHFLYALPKFESWDELKDLKVEFEYNRNSTGPIDLFVDSVWLEAAYEDLSEEDDLAGQENISHTLETSNGQEYDNTSLPVNSGMLIYTDDNDGEELIIKTEKRTYAGLTNNEILFSVTNTGSKDDEFQLQIYLPEKYGEASDLQQWMHYVPVKIEEAKFGTSAYFCNSGWETQEGEKYVCLQSGESYKCDELNQNKTNCIVEDVYVGSETRTGYRSTWKQEQFIAGEITQNGLFAKVRSLLKKKEAAVSSLEAKAYSAATYRIGGGQTLYFKMSLDYPVFSNGEFVIEAVGKDGYGILDPWWDSHWKKQILFSVDSGEFFSATQTVIDIDDSYTDFWSLVRSDGGDVRFTNEKGQELPFWIEAWDYDNNNASIWVRSKKELSDGREMFYLYYGNVFAENASDAYGTFSYEQEQNTSTLLNQNVANEVVSVKSLVENNTVSLDSCESVSLHKEETSVFVLSPGENILRSRGPVEISSYLSEDVLFTEDTSRQTPHLFDVYRENNEMFNAAKGFVGWGVAKNDQEVQVSFVEEKDITEESFVQKKYRWYVNENAQILSDPWPLGEVNIESNMPIINTPVERGEVVRLRTFIESAASSTKQELSHVRLQYSLNDVCENVSEWSFVGNKEDTFAQWRGFANSNIADGSSLLNIVLSQNENIEGSYEDDGLSTAFFTVMEKGGIEYDWVIQNNQAASDAHYCFRVVHGSGREFSSYEAYPQLSTALVEVESSSESVSVYEEKMFSIGLLSKKKEFGTEETPEFRLRYKREEGFLKSIGSAIKNLLGDDYKDIDITARVHGLEGGAEVVYIGDGKFDVLLQDKRQFRPGKNKLVLLIKDGEDVFTEEMEFVWGVLALNTDRTIYTPGSEAYIQMGVLNETGHTVCDADIILTITSAFGEEMSYSTRNGTVQKSGVCSGDSYVEVPDYFVYYPIEEGLGEYQIHFSATRNGKTHSIEDIFEVRENIAFDVERSGPTRIYPPEKYSVNFSIVAEQDFSGVIEERVPKSFETYQQTETKGYDGARMEEDAKVLFWNVDINAGEKIDLGYLFDAPDISPAFYLIGPLVFKGAEHDEIEFEELRKWQIAGDATAGDIAIYREILGTDVITTANFDHNWDNTVVESSSSFNLNADNTQIELQSGHYAVMYGARFDTTGSNKRSEFQTQLRLNGADLPVGWSQGFMSRLSGANEAFTAGGGIIEVATNDDPLVLRTFRTDANSAGAARAANVSSITLLALDDTWDYLRLSRSTTQTGPTGATWVDVQYNRQDEYDTDSFTHSTTTNPNNITLDTAGHYLVFANTYGAITTADKTLVRQRLTLDGAQIDGTLTTVLNHGNVNGNSTMEGAVSLGTIIETTSADQILNVELNRGDGIVAWTINSNDAGSYVDRTAITVAKLPDDADYIRLDDSGTDDINPATLTALGWNTEDEIDTDSFTHSTTTNDSRITIDVDDDYLFFSSNYAATIGISNAVFNQGWTKNGGALTQYGQTGNFNDGTGSNDAGNWSGIIFHSLVENDYIEAGSQQLGATGVIGDDVKGVQGVRISSLFGVVSGVPVFNQNYYRWYTNLDDQTPTDAWPSGAALDIGENTPITSTSTPSKPGDVLRLRMSTQITNATTTASTTAFKLQFGSGEDCTAVTEWTDVGKIASSTVWRGYNNVSVSDGATLSSTTLSVSDVAESYEEENLSTSTPNAIGVDQDGEWDWVLYNNTATSSTNYCFRMTEDDGTEFTAYTNYPQVRTNYSPTTTAQTSPFRNEKIASTTSWFDFSSTDPEGGDLEYQIQVDDDPLFVTPIIDKNSVNHTSQFENLSNPADKAPFNSGDNMRFTSQTVLSNGTTYWWRIRAKDPNDSTQWGEWSTGQSLTVDTSVTISTWHQTTLEQFATDTHADTEATTTGDVVLTSPATVGTTTSSYIDYDWKSIGNAWGSLGWNDNETAGDILYHVEYLNGALWELVPDTYLSGNAAGFDASPINLFGLEPATHNQIRLRADLTDSGGTPRLLDWTVEWGLAVSQPATITLFDNEKTGTTTPSFTFYSTDPQSDDLEYQVSISTSTSFTASTTRISSLDDGFSNTASTTDTSPFVQGDTILFSVQPADTLNNNETYWWRVRAKDPDGSNVWSSWSSLKSFTVDTTVVTSTWFQTTSEQFETGTLSGAQVSGGNVVVSTSTNEAMIVYGEGTVTTPRYRTWNGSSWSSESNALSVDAQINWVINRAAPGKNEYAMGTLSTDGDVNVQIYTPTGGWTNLSEITTTISNINARGFDIAYETNSENIMAVSCDGDADPTYVVWNGTSWGTPGSINLSSADNCEWIRLVSDPISNEIIILARDTGSQFEAQVWNGSSWGNSTTLGSISESANEGMAVEYEESGGQAIIVTSNGNAPSVAWNTWNGTTWGTAATQSLGDDMEWGQLSRDEGTDALVLCYVDHDGDIGTMRWTGSAWTGQAELETVGNAKTDRPVSCTYETTSGRDGYIMVPYSDDTNARYSYWNGSSWSAEASVSTITDSSTVASARAGDGKILSVFFDDVNGQLDFSYWNGSAWSTVETLESNPSVSASPFKEPFMIATRNRASAGKVTSSAIDFDDGTGPYWNNITWNDTEAGISTLLYQVQYYSTTTSLWTLVPDLEIPNNNAGTSTGPIDLSALNTDVYNQLQLIGNLTCEGADCPVLHDWTLSWAEGISISGTAKQYDQTSNVTSGTVAVAVNGVLQSGKTGTISGGLWTITNITAFADDVITVFVTGAADVNEAIGITKYDGTFNITGVELFERHVSLGSDDLPTISNTDISQYDNSVSGGNEDIFFDVDASDDLTVCHVSGCGDAELYIGSTTTYRPGSGSSANIITHDIEINGTLTLDDNTAEVSGSWDNNGIFNKGGSSVIFDATSTVEFIDSTGATTSVFNNVVFGQTSGTAIWNASSTLDIDGNLLVDHGSLDMSLNYDLLMGGNATINANGVFVKGTATTTFDGGGTNNWTDNTASKQDIGIVVIDGSVKTIQLGSDVKVTDIYIGGDDVLDVTTNDHNLTVVGSWDNNNTFLSRQGTVTFTSTTTGETITAGGSSFHDLAFSGSGGGWTFQDTNVTIDNDLTITAGSVTLPTVTTTITGSLSNSDTFTHTIGTVFFNSSVTGKTVDPGSSTFYNTTFDNVSGGWTIAANATSTNDFSIINGSVTMPSGVYAIEGTFDNQGTFVHNDGMVIMYSTIAGETITAGGSSFHDLAFSGSGGGWTFQDTNVTIDNDLTITAGSVTLPTVTTTITGSLSNSDTFTHTIGTVFFNSSTTGETINTSTSTFYNVTFDHMSGGWSVLSNATSTNNWSLANADSFSASGVNIEVQGSFQNSLDGNDTDWNGSTLYLNSGTSYSINTKTDIEDKYDTLSVGSDTDVSMWNSSATTTTVDPSGSLYSQDHGAMYGDLYIWGDYVRTNDIEYWSYNTDFDGEDLSGGSERQVDVRLASGATTTISGEDALIEIIGSSTASTTVDSQSGTYAVVIASSTIEANYYSFRYLDTNGLQFTGSTTVVSLDNGDLELADLSDGGTMITVDKTAIEENPLLQLFDIRFATSTGVTSGSNVTQSGGAPSSYWWFRDHTGNYDGESFDSDTGNPGSIRWDDSNLTITVSGVVYASNESTSLGGPTCDGVTQVVSLKVDGLGSYTSSCNGATGAYSIAGVTYNGDVDIIIFLDNAPGGERGSVVTRTPTANIANADIYAERVVVRHEDTSAVTIANMATYDSSDDPDIPFTATTSLVVDPETELHVWTNNTFTPGGNITLSSGGSGASYDGTLHVDDSAGFIATGAEQHSVGGSWSLDTGAYFVAANSTVIFTATTTGKTIQPQFSAFSDIVFNGTGGRWSIDGNTTVNDDIVLTAGEVIGTSSITVNGGDITGDGTFNMIGGTVALSGTGLFGGSADWSFSGLSFGDGVTVASTTKTGTNTITSGGVFTIVSGHILHAGGQTWKLSGGGTSFVVGGIFDAATSTFQYTSTSTTNITTEDYYHLGFMATAGSPVYTILNGGLNIAGNMTAGDGVNNVSITANTNDPIIDVAGDVIINQNATFTGSNSNNFTIAGSWTNDGSFGHGGGTVTFDSSDAGELVSAGLSPFYNIAFNSSSGGWTIAQSATSTNNWSLTNAANFTASSTSVIEVGGIFTTALADATTTWSGATLYINSGTSQTINSTSTGADTYSELKVGANTGVRMWNSTSTTYTIDATGSLYSQDHNAVDGSLYIWGDYDRSSGADHWSCATDFDGTDLSGGSERQVEVRFVSGSEATFTGGSLYIIGTSTATSTVDTQSTGTYGLTINGGNINAQYYQFRNMNNDGLNLLGSSAVTELSNGDYELGVEGGSMISVAGTVINANPIKTFSGMKFATSSGITSGYNFDVSGASVSSWRITGHSGNYDGEDFDNDSGGDPGYIVWDDSAADITISGYVYSDEGSMVSGVCDDSTPVVRLMVQGGGNRTSSCSSATGAYSISGVFYSPGDVLTVYLDNASGGERAANVTVDPFTNITMNLYEDRVIVRHEDSDPITISDLSVYDLDQDADIPFDADLGTPYTLVLPADTKLIIWDNKTFVPDGNITLNSSGSGNNWDGTLAIRNGATFSAAGAQAHSIGGSWIASSTAAFVSGGSTVTFTATTSGKTILASGSSFNNITFNGSGGSWTIQDVNATSSNDVTISAGSVTLPSGTFAVGGTFNNSGGSFTYNGGDMRFYSTNAETITANGSSMGGLVFDGSGSWTMQDTNATSTGSVSISSGVVTLPSGIFEIGGSFDNTGGSFSHNSGELYLTSTATTTTITAGGSDLKDITFDGLGGVWTFQDVNATTTGDMTIQNGGVILPTGTSVLQGSFVNSGYFTHSIGTILFSATTTGHTINAATSTMFNTVFDGVGGGWTVSSSATSTNDWSLVNAQDFTVSSGKVIEVQGDFSNLVGGASTTWGGATLKILSGNTYSINTKTAGGDEYDTLEIGSNTNISMWNSAATTTTVASSSYLYSQDHGGSDGDLYIWGNYARSSGSEYWSYATDFDGVDLSGGSERQVDVRIASNATTTFSGGNFEIIGTAVLPTTVQNQGSGTYMIEVSGGTFNALYYQFRNTNSDGLQLTGTPTITSLDSGDFELSVNGGTMISVSSTTIDQNASKIISGVAFATSTGITSGYNVTRVGTSSNAWTFTGHTGNYDGEAYDHDGGGLCGQIRWNDSTCLFVNQANYRWRNDDGGEGVPSSEWFDSDWDKRKRIRATETSGASLTNFQMKIVVEYDSDMQSDFGDLRFTDSGGTTTLDYWIESYISSASSTVWVKIPSITANSFADIYMYYDNVGAVTTTGVGTSTFVFFDDFEDGNISEYSGDTSSPDLFNVGTSFNYEGTYGLDAAGTESSKTTDGIYRTDTTISQGETIRFFQYVNQSAGPDDEPCTLFGVQTPGSDNNNYAVCLDAYPSDMVIISKDVYSNSSENPATELATTSVTWSTGWYEVEIDWLADDTIYVTVYDTTDGSVFATTTTSDSSYSSGGMGFSYWYQNGGWDFYTSREYAASDPTYVFGLEQLDSGASWKVSENSSVPNQLTSENVRVRFGIQNTGPAITDQNFRLQYADKAAYANCLAVPYINYNDVPATSGGCGTDAACMTSSVEFSNRASTTRLLSIPNSLTYAQGQIMEDPSNETNNMGVPENDYTEVEYNFQMTFYATSSVYCFRVTDGGVSLDNYSQMAEMRMLHAPNIVSLTLNGDQNISLVEDNIKSVSATGTVVDLNGYEDLVFATSTIYRSGVGMSCSNDLNNCYQLASSSCSFLNCSDNACDFSCTADLQYFADPTDTDSDFEGQSWLPQVTIYDSGGNSDTSSGLGVLTYTMRALSVAEGIDYGTLSVGSTTEDVNATTTIKNTGNDNIDVSLDGTDLVSAGGSITVNNQKYATSTFTYSACVICKFLTGTSTDYEIDLPKPTSTTTPSTDEVFWGIQVPTGSAGLSHQGVNTFIAKPD